VAAKDLMRAFASGLIGRFKQQRRTGGKTEKNSERSHLFRFSAVRHDAQADDAKQLVGASFDLNQAARA
jgi:hypothetical protein